MSKQMYYLYIVASFSFQWGRQSGGCKRAGKWVGLVWSRDQQPASEPGRKKSRARAVDNQIQTLSHASAISSASLLSHPQSSHLLSSLSSCRIRLIGDLLARRRFEHIILFFLRVNFASGYFSVLVCEEPRAPPSPIA